MNRRLLLIAACAVLPSASLGAQIVQPGGSVDARAQGNEREERKSKKKSALTGLGMGIGGGMAFALQSDAESVTQQEWCISACGSLRSSAARSTFGVATGSLVGANVSTSAKGASNAGGVLALLESLGTVSENAIDAVSGAPGQGNGNDDAPGLAVAAEQRALAASRKAAKTAAKSDNAVIEQPDFDAALNGCVLGCNPAPTTFTAPAATGAENGLFVAGAASGPVLLAAGDVNTIVNPEPSTILLMVGGLAAMAAVARRKRNVA